MTFFDAYVLAELGEILISDKFLVALACLQAEQLIFSLWHVFVCLCGCLWTGLLMIPAVDRELDI